MSPSSLLQRLLIVCSLGLSAGCGNVIGGQVYAIAYVEGMVLGGPDRPVGARIITELYDVVGDRCSYDKLGGPITTFDYTNEQGRYRVRMTDLIEGERCLTVRVRTGNPEFQDTTIIGPRVTMRLEDRGVSFDVVTLNVTLRKKLEMQ